jgi:hypothetical protein
MQQSGRERRRKPRYNADLPCSIALAEAERDNLFINERLDCRTRDLSETGVGVIAGSIYIGYTCVVDEGRALIFTLELPNGVVEIEAMSAHYLRLDAGGSEASYLIGLRINSISDAHRALYNSHLEALSKSEQD